jgi:methyl-accepting chemotaxis protein
MSRRSSSSSFNSLKGKISLATSAMAIFTCAFGSIVYVTVSYLIKDTFVTVFIPFLLMAFVILIFGWWLSNEVIGPILKLSLLAKSMERSPMASMPKTSGSGETDELLETLYRNSQQLQAVVGMMEKVADGDLDIALAPLQTSDRLTNSFQKLLARVSESIYAKENLDRLGAAVDQVTIELARTRKGNLDIEIKTDLARVKDLSDTVRFLIHRFNGIITQVHAGASKAGTSAIEIQKIIRDAIIQDENRIREMGQAAAKLRESPNRVQKTAEQLSNSLSSADQSLEKARKGIEVSQQNTNSVNRLRKQVKEALNKTKRLTERSQEIEKIAKNLDDLSNRSSLIALNASVRAVGATENSSGFSVLAEEVERLSDRAGNTGKLMSGLNRSIAAEITEVEESLHGAVGEVANISKFAIEGENSLGEIERYLGQFLNLQSQLAENSSQQTAETEAALEVFTASLSNSANMTGSLRQAEAGLADLPNLMENLRSAVADFRVQSPEVLPLPPVEETLGMPAPEYLPETGEFDNAGMPEDLPEMGEAAREFELEEAR